MLVLNKETIRDFCGTQFDKLHYDEDSISIATYVYFIPDAIKYLCVYFHWPHSSDSIWNYFIKRLENKIPLDSNRWDDPFVIDEVFDYVYHDPVYGTRLTYVANRIMESDYWQAYMWIENNCNDPHMKRILNKSINNKRLDKVVVTRDYWDTFE